MIDLDLSDIKILNATLKRIHKSLGVSPTVLWTGSDYHIYLSIKTFVLEEEQVFARFVAKLEPDLSTKFLWFAKPNREAFVLSTSQSKARYTNCQKEGLLSH